MMGQCFGTDDGGLFTFKQKRGYDRFTRFAPKSKWRYADEHLLTEIQDPRSDDEVDLSEISRVQEENPRQTNPRQTNRASYSSNNTTGYKQERQER